MTLTAIVTYFHFIAIILLFVSLSFEKLLFKKEIDLKTAKKIVSVDGFYGLSAVLILITGLLKYTLYGKGMAYYNHNYLMWIKLSLFLIIGILSIKPTIYFLKWRKNIREGIPIVIAEKDYKKISMTIHIELTLVILIPLLATFLARGFGYFQ